MRYPQDFVVLSKGNQAQYSAKANGNLVLSRLAAGHSRHWQSSAFETIEEKKILILTDWTEIAWSAAHRLKVQSILRYLLEEGFVIYIEQSETLELLTVFEVEKLPSIPLRKDQYWIDLAEKHGIPNDKLLLLNDYWLRAVADESLLNRPREIELSLILGIIRYNIPRTVMDHIILSKGLQEGEFENKYTDIATTLFNDLGEALEGTSPKIESIVQDIFSPFANNFIKGLRNVRANFKTLFLPAIPCFSESGFLLNGVLFPINQLKNIEHLGLFADSESFNLELVLTALPRLKRLELRAKQKLSLNFFNSNYLFSSSITHLKLHELILSQKNLLRCLSQLPSLYSLDLMGTVITEGFEESTFQFKDLKSLKIATTEMSEKTRDLLFEASADVVEELWIPCSDLKSLSKFKKLTSVGLFNGQISLDDLLFLLEAIPSLKTLSLNSVTFGDLELLSSKTYRLENLILMDVNDPYATYTLLKILPNLNYLGGFIPFPSNDHIEAIEKILKNKKINCSSYHNFLDTSCFSGDYRSNCSAKSSYLMMASQKRLDPVHQTERYLSFSPTPQDFKFQYQPTFFTKAQDKITAQLSQYLTITHRKIHFISKIQDGICGALAQLFIELNNEEWDALIEGIINWEGDKKTLTAALEKHFSLIVEKYKAFYIKRLGNNDIYLGLSGIPNYLETKPFALLSNPWHAIAVKKNSMNNDWMVYDPNYVEGYKVVASNDLTVTLQNSLGTLIRVKDNFSCNPDFREKPADFIGEGGLLILAQTAPEQLPHLLKPLQAKALPAKDLKQGLFLRATSGVPAWKLSLSHSSPVLKNYVHALLEQLKFSHPEDFLTLLISSLAHLGTSEQSLFAQDLFASDSVIEKEIAIAIFNDLDAKTYNPAYFAPQFETWRKESASIKSKKAYCQRLVNGTQKKRLIDLPSTPQVKAMGLALVRYCQAVNRPVFFIHSPDEIVCSSPYIKKEGKNGMLKRGPGGALHNFLSFPYENNTVPILIVNYDNFSPDDFVRLNSLLDKVPLADGTPLPKEACLIGLINTSKPSCYQGGDFYSRFGSDAIERCTLAAEELIKPLPPLLETNEEKVFSINLYHQQNWEERLLGGWVLKKDKLVFKKGLLARALKSDLVIEIQNGLWENQAFCDFFDRARVLQRIDYDGEIFDLSNKLFTRKEGYNWSHLLEYGHWSRGLIETEYTLNPTQFNQFFTRYKDKNKTLIFQKGWIEAHQGQDLHLNLTRSLSEHEWAALLAKAAEHGVKLHCHAAANVILPPFFNIEPTAFPTTLKSSNIRIISSPDIDVTVAQLTADKDWQIIDVSECTSEDLLKHIHAEVKTEEEKAWFEFTISERALLKALADNKKILLKGKISPELADGLAPLLLTKEGGIDAQPLWIVTSDASYLDYLPVEYCEVSPQDKLQVLKPSPAEEEKIAAYLPQESTSRLRARLNHSGDPWKGLEGLSGGLKLEPFEIEKSAVKAEAFLTQRRQLVYSALAKSPYIFLTGVSGVGKSTFVEKEFAKHLYNGLDTCRNWAQDKGNYLKILFLDEANLLDKDWSEFEDLFNDPPSILIDGVYYPLDATHKVIFAGNPLNYGGQRRTASLFNNHGNAVLFEPMPPEFIYEVVLKPLFINTPLENHLASISSQILKIYYFICECSDSELLISPRELEMIALLILANSKNLNHDNALTITNYFARQVVRALVPLEKLAEFDALFLLEQREFAPPPHLAGDFLLTPSRMGLWQQLQEWTSLRDYRRQHKSKGGLGALIIEGEPGIGKSELVFQYLENEGYQRVHLLSDDIPEKAYYYLSITMELDEKKNFLLKALKEGALVVIDEINSLPLDESLFNNLLMGKNQDGSWPEKAGFMIIGTQNPPEMGARYRLPPPLKRRTTTVKLPPYTFEELQAILINKGFREEIAQSMITAYNQKLEEAHQKQLNPLPTVRDLLTVAKKYQENSRLNPTNLVISDIIDNVGTDSSLDFPSRRSSINYFFIFKCLNFCFLTLGILALIATALLFLPPVTTAIVGMGVALGTLHTTAATTGVLGSLFVATNLPLAVYGLFKSPKTSSHENITPPNKGRNF